MHNLYCETREPRTLLPAELEAMYRLFERYYEEVAFERFVADLREKAHCLRLFDSAQQLRGFSTMSILEVPFQGESRRAIFSGDTIVDHRFWGDQTLVLEWCRVAGAIKAQQPSVPLYWFLICKGHRTYRFLHCFSERFYPTWRYPTPPEVKAYMDQMATMKFGSAYDSERGVVDFGCSLGQLRAEWDGFARVSHNRDVAYFKSCNPECGRGTELMCLTELATENLRRTARDAFCRGMSACELLVENYPVATLECC